MSKAKFILETINDDEQYQPTLFIFKNEAAVMLTDEEIKELKILINNIN